MPLTEALCSVARMLPDWDSDNGKLLWELVGVTAALRSLVRL
jgi:hypothetical protein